MFMGDRESHPKSGGAISHGAAASASVPEGIYFSRHPLNFGPFGLD
jgi:hypothetical protein